MDNPYFYPNILCENNVAKNMAQKRHQEYSTDADLKVIFCVFYSK